MILTEFAQTSGILSWLPPTFWDHIHCSGFVCKASTNTNLLKRSISCLYLWHSSVKSNKPLVHSMFLANLDTLDYFEMNSIIGLETQLKMSKLLTGGGGYQKLWRMSKVLPVLGSNHMYYQVSYLLESQNLCFKTFWKFLDDRPTDKVTLKSN